MQEYMLYDHQEVREIISTLGDIAALADDANVADLALGFQAMIEECRNNRLDENGRPIYGIDQGGA